MLDPPGQAQKLPYHTLLCLHLCMIRHSVMSLHAASCKAVVSRYKLQMPPLFACKLTAGLNAVCRYDVYSDLQAEAAFLRLNDNGVYLLQLQAAFANLQYLVNKLAWYYALNGINILLLIGRVLKRMDFQPRLGVVTRSLALAGPDLIHFCLVCGMVFVGYAMMAHLIFGNTIQVLHWLPPHGVNLYFCVFMRG